MFNVHIPGGIILLLSIIEDLEKQRQSIELKMKEEIVKQEKFEEEIKQKVQKIW